MTWGNSWLPGEKSVAVQRFKTSKTCSNRTEHTSSDPPDHFGGTRRSFM